MARVACPQYAIMKIAALRWPGLSVGTIASGPTATSYSFLDVLIDGRTNSVSRDDDMACSAA